MKKLIKFGVVTAIAVVAGFAAYQSYGSYGAQDNSLLMQNVEALAESNPEPGGKDNGDANGKSYHYPDKASTVQLCCIYVYKNLSAEIVYSSPEPNAQLESNGSYIVDLKRAIYDDCNRRGNGCTPFPCQIVEYVN